MSGTGSSEPTFIIDLPALRGLRDRGLLDAGPESALYWFVEQPVAEEEVETALAAMRERELLLGDPEQLDPRLHASLEVLAHPLLRLRVVHVTDVPRSVVTYSDGVGAVSLLTNGREMVITPLQSHESIARRISAGIAADLGSRGPRVELVGAEVALVGLVAPLAREGGLDATRLIATVGELGGRLSEADASAALAELVAAGWIEERDGSFALGRRAAEVDAIAATSAIELRATVITAEGESHRVHRFHRTGDRVWRIAPFLAGHDREPPEGASDDAVIATLTGLSFVPQSREMVEAFVFELLGVERERDAKKPVLGVKLRR